MYYVQDVNSLTGLLDEVFGKVYLIASYDSSSRILKIRNNNKLAVKRSSAKEGATNKIDFIGDPNL